MTRTAVRIRLIEAQEGWEAVDPEGAHPVFVDWELLEEGETFRIWLGRKVPYTDNPILRKPRVKGTEAWLEVRDPKDRTLMIHIRQVDEEVPARGAPGLFTRKYTWDDERPSRTESGPRSTSKPPY
jgi:hypothetical protein